MSSGKVTRPIRVLAWTVSGLLALFALWMIVSCYTGDSTPDDRRWTYSTLDLPTGKVIEMAQVNSNTTLKFKPPYEGGATSTLMLTRDKGASDAGGAMFDITRTQFLCEGGCEVTAKFDEGPALRFPARLPGDGTKILLVIGDEQRFVEHLKKSTRLVIQADFHAAAGQQLEFNTANLKW